MTELSPSALKRLRDVYDRYRTAPLGQLNATAIELQTLCSQLGWSSFRDGKSYRAWAADMLGERL